VFGSEATTITFDTILELLHLEFPSFRLHSIDITTGGSVTERNHTDDMMTAGGDDNNDNDDVTVVVTELIQYGIVRLNISESYTHIKSRPQDPTSNRIGLDLDISVRIIVAFALMVICLLVGLYIIGRYIYIQRLISKYDDRTMDNTIKKHNTDFQSNRWTWFGRKDETDVTETSSSASLSVSVSCGDSRDGNGRILHKVRALCHPTRRRRRRRQYRRPESMEFTLSGGVTSIVAYNDSIYIVESEDEDEESDAVYHGNLQPEGPCHSYTTSESRLICNDIEPCNFDPLSIRSSIRSDRMDITYE
jgi:hypothetical protein